MTTHLPLAWACCALAVLAAPAAAHAADPVSFRNDVMAVLSRGGCNAGPCHGNLYGKGGFKLSLRGEDPDFDFQVLTRDMLARRTDPHDPAASLLLTKATATVAHEGTRRFAVGSPEYDLLRRWIAAGCRPDAPGTPALTALAVTPTSRVLVEPADAVALKVRATFSDGTTRDVSGLACYETSNLVAKAAPDGTVRREDFGETTVLVRYLDRQVPVTLAFVPARPGYTWEDVPANNFIDTHVFAKLRTLRVRPSGLADDSVFLRRAYLDTLGVLPTPAEARAFLADADPKKRDKLIDALVRRPEFADFWALKWSDLLRNEEKVLDAKGVALFHGWIRASIAEGKPLDVFARELIASRGSTYSHPAANYYRALRDPQARAEATAQVFLGLRLQCAKCHNHPFDRWKQDDYHGLAAFFARVDYRIVENNRKDRLDKHEFAGEQVVFMARTGEVLSPRTKEPLAPLFLGSPTPKFEDGDDRLEALADWVTSPDNPFFARTQANRVWSHLVGRGVVDPNDDFRATNPPANAALLDALAKDLVAHKFDLRHLVTTVMKSRTYQLSAVPNDTNRDDEANFAHAQIRPLQAEQLLDALAGVLQVPQKYKGVPEGTRAGQVPGVNAPGRRGAGQGDSDKFMAVFGKPMRSLNCDCERSDDTTLNQAFQLITGPMLNNMLTAKDNRIGRLLEAGRPAGEIVEELYLAALCRPPTAKERERAAALVAQAADRRAALEDIAWGLVNAKEFLLRR